MDARGDVKSVEIEAVIIRADGRRENLGTISYWHKNPFMRALHACKMTVRRWLTWQR